MSKAYKSLCLCAGRRPKHFQSIGACLRDSHRHRKAETPTCPFSNRHLLDTFSFIDKNKVAVWGWSYGGFVAARMLAEDNDDVIKCTAAVAPVTKWQLYGKSYVHMRTY